VTDGCRSLRHSAATPAAAGSPVTVLHGLEAGQIPCGATDLVVFAAIAAAQQLFIFSACCCRLAALSLGVCVFRCVLGSLQILGL
jgi:hypothetical protein